MLLYPVSFLTGVVWSCVLSVAQWMAYPCHLMLLQGKCICEKVTQTQRALKKKTGRMEDKPMSLQPLFPFIHSNSVPRL